MRILLLLPTTSYKAKAFLEAAAALDAEVVVGTERRQALDRVARGHSLAVDFARPERNLVEIRRLHEERPFACVVGVDDESAFLAALAARELGLPHVEPEAIRAARDKGLMRTRLRAAGVPGPAFHWVSLDADPRRAAEEARYPCVLKPLNLSAGRGVLRADDPAAFVAAFARVAKILRARDVRRMHGRATQLLVEDYLPGIEVAVEALMQRGELTPLALFDKPDPLEGPTFEETIYVTPSRLSAEVQRAVVDETARAALALGLTHGPIHAELRIDRDTPTILEIAPRTIGGLCSRTLRFGYGITLEEVVLRQALGRDLEGLERDARAAGVLMLPTRKAGKLVAVHGLDAARSVPGIEGVTITVPRGARLVPLPEGHRYLGFAFARGDAPPAVEHALREAWAKLTVEVA